MTVRACLASLGLAIALGGCAQAPTGPAHFTDPHAQAYVSQHGVRVDVSLPKGPLVSAAVVIDSATASAAQATTDQMAASMRGNGLIGLAVTTAVSAQSGAGALQRKAQAAADQDAKPLASLLGGMPMDTGLARRYQAAAVAAGLPEGKGAVVARLAVTPHIVLTADRAHWVLSSDIRLEDIAGGALYSARVEVGSPSLRRCGADCIDDGQLEQARIDAALEACVSETLRLVAQDISGTAAPIGPERTLRYVLDGQRVVERGRLLSGSAGYLRYLALDGAVKAMPVALEGQVMAATIKAAP